MPLDSAVAEEVKAKEAALGVCDISGMTKFEAVGSLRDKVAKSEFTPREAAAISLVDRIVVDPHSVDDALFAELRRHFSDEEIIELLRHVAAGERRRVDRDMTRYIDEVILS